MLTDAEGNIKSRRDFMPFGEEIHKTVGDRSNQALNYDTSEDNVKQKFTGYERDGETGLDFAQARMYNNQHARFTAVDPLLASGKSTNPQTFNRYVYVMNSPLLYTDPDGLQAGHHKGDVYFYTSNGGKTYHLATWKKDGRYNIYENRTITVTGNDGYRYRLFRGGWTQLNGRRQRRQRKQRQRRTKRSPKASKGGLRVMNRRAMNNFGNRGNAALKLNALAAASGAGIGACVATGTCAAVAGAAATTAAKNPQATALFLGGAFGIGAVGMVDSSGAGDFDHISQQLATIYEQNPSDSSRCECVAREALEVFNQAGIEGEVVQIGNGYNNIVRADGKVIGDQGFHQVVRVADRYFDSLTYEAGMTEGATWDEYTKLFQAPELIEETPVREYIPPQP